MAKRANGVSEFSRVGLVMTWTYGGDVAPTVFDMASNPAVASFDEFTLAVYANGCKQKIGDAAAIENATVAEKALAQRDVAAQLVARQWSGERSSLFAEALQRLYPKSSAAEIANTIKGMTKPERRAVENDLNVIKMVATIQTERAKKSNVDAGAILARFQKH